MAVFDPWLIVYQITAMQVRRLYFFFALLFLSHSACLLWVLLFWRSASTTWRWAR